MDKPTPKIIEIYDWIDLERYYETKTGKRIRDILGKFHDNKAEVEYLDFWHLLIDLTELKRGMPFDFLAAEWQEYPEVQGKPWAMEILRFFQEEFGDSFIVEADW